MKANPSIYLFVFCLLLFSCKSRQPALLFEKITPSASGINFKNILSENEKLNAFSFVNYYNGGGVATGDINNDGLADIYFTANSKGGNKLYLNKGNFQFEDITGKAGVAGISDWCTGVTMADVNADGFLDIYVCSVQGKLDRAEFRQKLLAVVHRDHVADAVGRERALPLVVAAAEEYVRREQRHK